MEACTGARKTLKLLPSVLNPVDAALPGIRLVKYRFPPKVFTFMNTTPSERATAFISLEEMLSLLKFIRRLC